MPSDDRTPDALISVRVTPRASRTRVWRAADGIRVSVTAPPVDSAANAAVIEALAKVLGVAKSNLEIVSGSRGRSKRIAVRGINQAEIEKLASERIP